MRHTSEFIKDGQNVTIKSIYAERCKICNNILEIKNIQTNICPNCKVEREIENIKRAAANRKRSQSGLLGTLKQRISSALARSLRSKSFRAKEKPNLTMTFLLELYDKQKGKCALSGRDLSLGSIELNKYDNNVLSLDRIDPSRGYVEDNVQFVTYQVNIAKGRHSNKEFIEMCKDVLNRSSSGS